MSDMKLCQDMSSISLSSESWEVTVRDAGNLCTYAVTCHVIISSFMHCMSHSLVHHLLICVVTHFLFIVLCYNTLTVTMMLYIFFPRPDRHFFFLPCLNYHSHWWLFWYPQDRGDPTLVLTRQSRPHFDTHKTEETPFWYPQDRGDTILLPTRQRRPHSLEIVCSLRTNGTGVKAYPSFKG